MKVEVLELTDTAAKLVLDEVNHAFVNALRRTLLAEVPKMAIEDVTIYDNTGALFDEMVAHRLGLVPVPTDLAALVPREECTCANEGCVNCTILYTLSKEGPALVTSGDLTPADPAHRIKDEGIPIVKLLEGQRLMLECGAVLGTSARHSKWSAVHGAAYREYPVVKVEGAISAEDMARLQNAAPPGAVNFDGGKVTVVDLEAAWKFLRSAKTAWKIDAIQTGFVPGKFIFDFETDSSVTAKDALKKAVALIMDKLREIETEVPKLKMEEPEPAVVI